MDKLMHSVYLDKDKCLGCTTCLRSCPTGAIRVREGKAKIIESKCIDCGECIRVCPHHAKMAKNRSAHQNQRLYVHGRHSGADTAGAV